MAMREAKHRQRALSLIEGVTCGGADRQILHEGQSTVETGLAPALAERYGRLGKYVAEGVWPRRNETAGA